MKEWLSNKKSALAFIASACAIVGLSVWLIIGLINGSILTSLNSLISVLAPLIIGFIIAYLCNPIVSFFEKKLFKKIKRFGVKRGLSIFITFAILIFIIYIVFVQFVPEAIYALDYLFNTFFVNYEASVRIIVYNINNFVRSVPFLKIFGELNADVIVAWINELDLDKIITWVEEFRQSTSGNVSLAADSLLSAMGYVFSIGTSIVNGAKNFLLGLFISFYMLMSKEKSKAHIRRALNAFLPPKKVRGVIRFGKLMDHSFGGFIEGKIIDSFIIGIISYIAFVIFKLPSPYVLAIIIGVTDLIPIFGPIIGAIPAGIIVLLTNPDKLLLFIVLIIIIQQLEGNIISPLILGDRVNISSFSVIVSIVVMGGLFGVLGMVIGVPVFAVIIHLFTGWVTKKLAIKGMGTELEEYYVGDPEEAFEVEDRSNKLIVKIFHWIGSFFKKLWNKIFKKDAKHENNEEK